MSTNQSNSGRITEFRVETGQKSTSTTGRHAPRYSRRKNAPKVNQEAGRRTMPDTDKVAKSTAQRGTKPKRNWREERAKYQGALTTDCTAEAGTGPSRFSTSQSFIEALLPGNEARRGVLDLNNTPESRTPAEMDVPEPSISVADASTLQVQVPPSEMCPSMPVPPQEVSSFYQPTSDVRPQVWDSSAVGVMVDPTAGSSGNASLYTTGRGSTEPYLDLYIPADQTPTDFSWTSPTPFPPNHFPSLTSMDAALPSVDGSTGYSGDPRGEMSSQADATFQGTAYPHLFTTRFPLDEGGQEEDGFSGYRFTYNNR